MAGARRSRNIEVPNASDIVGSEVVCVTDVRVHNGVDILTRGVWMIKSKDVAKLVKSNAKDVC